MTKYLGIAVAAVLATAVLSFGAGKGCRGHVAPLEAIDVSEADTEADRRRLEASAEARAVIQKLETAHAADLESFNLDQARKYEQVRASGPAATARWLADFDQSL